MYKLSIFLVIFFSIRNEALAQFNTIFPKQPIVVVQPEIIEPSKMVIEPTTEVVNYQFIKQRKYVSLPVDSMRITSGFGTRSDPFTGERKRHQGVDLKGYNDYVYAIMPGKVVRAGRDKKLGNFIEVEHGSFKTVYGHLSRFLVKAKQAVEAGEPIAVTGSTGRSTGEHLHFGIKLDNIAIDPTPILKYINDLIIFAKTQLPSDIEQAIRAAKR